MVLNFEFEPASRPLIVGYDGTAAVRQRAGIGRYARELLVALDELATGDRFRIIAATGGAEDHRPKLGDRFRWHDLPLSDRLTNALWQRLRVPAPVEARVGCVDVFHSPDFSLAPSLAPSVVTIHDLAFETMPQVSYPSLAAYLHTVVPRSVRRARLVIAPSEHTKQAIVRTFGTAEGKVRVVPEGVSPLFSAAPQPDDEQRVRALGLTGPYLASAGTLEPRKNIERLLKAFAQIRPVLPDLTLALAGQRGWLDEGIFEVHRELQIGDAVRFLGFVGDADLTALYRRAEVVVYPSLLEGFGLPALEALSCGAAVICSGNSSMPEACGDAALYVDPWDVEDIAATIESVLKDSLLRSRLRQAGPAQAAPFTWQRAAETTLALYREVANG